MSALNSLSKSGELPLCEFWVGMRTASHHRVQMCWMLASQPPLASGAWELDTRSERATWASNRELVEQEARDRQLSLFGQGKGIISPKPLVQRGTRASRLFTLSLVFHPHNHSVNYPIF